MERDNYLLSDELAHHVSGVDVNGADGHDLLTIPGRELPQKHVYESIQLGNLQEKPHQSAGTVEAMISGQLQNNHLPRNTSECSLFSNPSQHALL